MSMDVQRAVAILKRASENQMYDGTKIPESDAAKIEVAEQQVQLCEQVEAMVHQAYPYAAGWTDDTICQKVPHWPAVTKILAEAKVLVGANEIAPLLQPGTFAQAVPVGTGPPPPGTTEISVEEASVLVEAQDSPELPVSPDAPPVSFASSAQSAWSPPSEPTTAASNVEGQAVSALDQGDPRNDEVWLDAQGNAWLVVHYSGGMSAQVKSMISGEGTIVPAGFLKKRAPEDQQEIAKIMEEVDQHIDAGEPDPAPPDLLPPPDATAASDAEFQKQMVQTEEKIRSAAIMAPLAINAGMPKPTVAEHVHIPPATASTDHEQTTESPDDAAIEAAKYQDLVEAVQGRYEPSGMPVPQDLADPPSIDAETFADLDDKNARIAHSKYNALSARAKYLHDIEDATSRACDLVKTHHMRRAMAVARKQLGSAATVTDVKIVAEDDPLVIEWTEYSRSHADEAKAYKTFFDIYSKHVEVLSRDWTMREKQVR